METLIVAGIIVFFVFFVLQTIYIVYMIRLSRSIRDFIRNSESKIAPAIAELQVTLLEVKKAASEASAVAGNVRELTETVTVLKRSIQGLYDKYKSEISEATKSQVAGIKAGLKAGVTTLVRNLSKEKSEAG